MTGRSHGAATRRGRPRWRGSRFRSTSTTPASRALRRRASAFYETLDELAAEFPDVARRHRAPGSRVVPVRAARRRPARERRSSSLSWEEPYCARGRRAAVRRDARRPGGPGARPRDAASRPSRRSPRRSSAACCRRRFRASTASSSPRATCRARPSSTSAATGSTPSRFPTGGSGSSSATSSARASQAASTMAQLRNALRAFSLDRMKPSSTLARLNRLAEEVVETTFATLVYAIVDPATRVCRFTSAGHPPPLVAYPDGRVELLEGGRGLPLGAGADTAYAQDVVELPVGTVLLLYTDGLVERRGRPIDDGLDELRRAALDGPREPEQLVEHILERLVGDGRARRRHRAARRPRPRRRAAAAPRCASRATSARSTSSATRSASWLAGAPLDRTDAAGRRARGLGGVRERDRARRRATTNAHVDVRAEVDGQRGASRRRGQWRLAARRRNGPGGARAPADALDHVLRRDRTR